MRLPDRVARALVAHAREAAPEECCGLLIGDHTQLTAAVRAANLADAPERRYLIDPRDHFAALREARASGHAVVGAYHSHPRSSAIPSATDAAMAFAHFTFLIIGLGTDPPELGAWRWDEGNFVAVPLVRVSEGQG